MVVGDAKGNAGRLRRRAVRGIVGDGSLGVTLDPPLVNPRAADAMCHAEYKGNRSMSRCCTSLTWRVEVSRQLH